MPSLFPRKGETKLVFGSTAPSRWTLVYLTVAQTTPTYTWRICSICKSKYTDSDFITSVNEFQDTHIRFQNEFLDTLPDELSEIVHLPVETDQC